MAVEALSPDERRSLLLSVGTHRDQRPLSPIEVAELFERILKAGGSLADCARAANLEGTTIVGRFLRLRRLPVSVRHLVDWGSGAGTVGFSSAAEIARLGNEHDEEQVTQAVLANRLSGSEVRQVVQLRKRSNRPVAVCLTEVLGMRPRVETRHVYVGAVTNEQLAQKLHTLTQLQRDQLLAKAIGHVFPDEPPAVARLGTDRFTLVGGPTFGQVIKTKQDVLESDVNDALLREAL